MEKIFFRLSSALLLLFLISCVRQVSVPIRNVPPVLVVEGMVTTDPGPYVINLSYSGKFVDTYWIGADTNQYFITDAKVTIEDDLGDSSRCSWVGMGTYESDDSNFIGKVGRSYRVKIYLSDGKTYVSKPEILSAVASIDSLTVVYDSSFISDIRPSQFIISAIAHDPAGTQNFYRWTASGYIPRKSWGQPCSLVDPPCTSPFMCLCSALCEQYLVNNQVNILSDQFIEGRNIIQPVFYSPIYWFGKHFIEVSQLSLSRDAYEFWQQFLLQTNRTGSILDPLPASLTGNVHNQADSNDVALGFFSASDVRTKRIVITPFFLQQYFLESIAVRFIAKGDCHSVYANSIEDETDPPGWEDAQRMDIH